MKNNLLFLLTILSTLIISSCEKENDKIIVNHSPYPSMDHINFSIDDNLLIFESFDDYDQMYILYNSLSVQLKEGFEKHLGFYSIRNFENDNSLKTIEGFESLQTFLNPTKEMVVGNYLLEYDFENKKLTVSEFNDLSNADLCKSYSFDEDVVDILFFEGALSKKSVLGKCSTGNYTYATWELSNNTIVDCNFNFFWAPFDYTMNAKMTKTAFRPGIEMHVYVGDANMPSGYPSYWLKKNGTNCNPPENNYDHGTGSTVKATIFSSSKAVYAYRVYALFEAVDSYSGVAVTTDTYGIRTCNLNDLPCL